MRSINEIYCSSWQKHFAAASNMCVYVWALSMCIRNTFYLLSWVMLNLIRILWTSYATRLTIIWFSQNNSEEKTASTVVTRTYETFSNCVVKIYNICLHTQRILFDMNIEYFSRQHLPFSQWLKFAVRLCAIAQTIPTYLTNSYRHCHNIIATINWYCL